MSPTKPKPNATRRSRGPYSPACDNCRVRKAKCYGTPMTVCPPCQKSLLLCSWEKFNLRQNKGEKPVPETPELAEASHKLLLASVTYTNYLESLLDRYAQSHSFDNFRAHRPQDPHGLISMGDGDAHWDDDLEEEFDIETHDPDSLSDLICGCNKLTLAEGSLSFYGTSSPFRFRSDPLPVTSRFPAIAKNPEATYVLIIGESVIEDHYNPHLDWSRYLPAAVPLDRRSHDRALDLVFKYCTSFCLRVVPDLFLKDMCRVLNLPRSQTPPKSSHYSPMLHNALLALALAYLDDPKFRDLKSRQYFVDAAKNHMEAECQRPTISTVQAFSLLATFHGSQGEQGLGFIYFGLSARIAQALGLNVDCSEWVKLGLMDKSDQIDRNWASWTVFTSDVCWSLYVGRDFAVPLPDKDFPLPYVDTELDAMPVVYGKLPPQPNLSTKIFHAHCELFIIARSILDVINELSKHKVRPSIILEHVHIVDTKLNTWSATLSPDLQTTVKSRSTAPAHKLILHLSYWWLFILLHRPLFHQKAGVKTGQQIDHVKICKRAADGIMDHLTTWHELYGLRYSPVTLIQVAFSAGTVYLLLAIEACSGRRFATKELHHALEQQMLVVRYLHEVGRTWPGANKVAEILKDLIKERLRPVVERKVPRHSGDHDAGSSNPTPVRRRSSSRSHGPLVALPVRKRSSKRGNHGAQEGSGPFDITKAMQDAVSPAVPKVTPIPIPKKSDAAVSSPMVVVSHNVESGYITNSHPTSSPDIHFNCSPPNENAYPAFNLFTHPSPNDYFYSLSGNHACSGQAGPSNVFQPPDGSSSWLPLYPNTRFLGMAGGQTIPQAPFWSEFNLVPVDDLSSSADMTVLYDSAFDSNIPPEYDRVLGMFPTNAVNVEVNVEVDTDVSMDEANQFVQFLSELS